jgi:predicted dehydrogenase
MAAKVRWGILSTANIGRAALVPALQSAANAELLAVASRDHERAYGYATRYGIPHSYGSYDDLLRDREIDVVYIPLPNSMHHPWVLRALREGKHVLVEKPMGLSAAECLEMASVADAHGVRLMEGFMYRFHPQISTLLTLIDNGAIGRLQHMHAAFSFRLNRQENIRLRPELGGGSLMDVGCYCVNIFRTIADEEPVEVQALAKWHPGGVDESMCGTLRFASGVTAQFDCSLALARRETFLAAGPDATVELPRAFLPGTASTQVILRRGYGDVDTRTVAGVDEYRLMVEHFSDCVYTNTAPLFDAREAALNMRVIEALYKSAAVYGAPVPVEPLVMPALRARPAAPPRQSAPPPPDKPMRPVTLPPARPSPTPAEARPEEEVPAERTVPTEPAGRDAEGVEFDRLPAQQPAPSSEPPPSAYELPVDPPPGERGTAPADATAPVEEDAARTAGAGGAMKDDDAAVADEAAAVAHGVPRDSAELGALDDVEPFAADGPFDESAPDAEWPDYAPTRDAGPREATPGDEAADQAPAQDAPRSDEEPAPRRSSAE